MERVEGEVAIDIRQAVVTSASQKLDALSDKPLASDKFTIFRVPPHVRQRNKHLYEPQMVAIGPYGLRKDEPSLPAMQQLKWRYLQEFLSQSEPFIIDNYVADIEGLEPQARRCYFEAVELNTEKFMEMLLLDGCFIIEFLIKWDRGDKDGMFAAEWTLPLIRDDLLLLENQIPLSVLKKLFERRTFKDDTAATPAQRPASEGEMPPLMKLLKKYLASRSVESPSEKIKSSDEKVEGNHDLGVIAEEEIEWSEEGMQAKDFRHLLHLYHHWYVTKPQTELTRSTTCGTILKWLRPSRIFTLFFSYIPSKICTTHAATRSPRTIPSATELLEAGVTIKKKKTKKKKKQSQNRLSSFLDVTFSQPDGVLEIPFLSVEPPTLPRFANLVAFEQCGGCKPEEAYMTSYAVFMNCLINTREDVAILHKRGILENKLGSDKELAVFFNQLSDYAAVDYDNHYLAKLFREVETYCGDPWPSLRAKLVRDYFSYPWAILSLVAAVVILALTLMQTVYTMYAYYHPKN